MHILVFVFGLLPLSVRSADLEVSGITVLTVNSAITPATYDYLESHFETLPKDYLVVLKLNTPGGLVTTTKDIITLIGKEKRPFVVWITPEGASASSAGAIIASSAHYIFMSPGTNIGAATPVGLGNDIKESDGRNKILKDLTSLVRSLSVTRRRPSAPFEKMVKDAESYTAKEALEEKIIDGIISGPQELIDIMKSKPIFLDGVETNLFFKDSNFKYHGPTTGQKLLEVIANPTTAYFLFIIGIALVYFEFQAAGGFIAGAAGFCFLILSGIAFQVLPLNWGAFALIIAGIFLLILEIYVTSYGLLGIGGLAAVIMGSLFLFHSETGFISVKYSMLLSSLAGVVIGIGLVLYLLYRGTKKKSRIKDFFLPVEAKGIVLNKLNANEYQVRVNGEIWRALSDESLEINDHVEVIQVEPEKLRIRIKKLSQA